MKQELLKWLERFGLANTEYAYFLVVIGLIVLASTVLHIVLHRIVARFLGRARTSGRTVWQRAFSGHKLFSRLALALQGVVVFTMASAFLEAESPALEFIEALTHLWIIMFSLLALFSLLDAVEEISRSAGSAVKLPLQGHIPESQARRDHRGIDLRRGLPDRQVTADPVQRPGAMTAVVLLIFKDPILGLVAGIQLSANNMLAVGDWLEMPQYGADGDVIDISPDHGEGAQLGQDHYLDSQLRADLGLVQELAQYRGRRRAPDQARDQYRCHQRRLRLGRRA